MDFIEPILETNIEIKGDNLSDSWPTKWILNSVSLIDSKSISEPLSIKLTDEQRGKYRFNWVPKE